MKNTFGRRITFGSIPQIVEAPDLLNIQMESWDSFLQAETQGVAMNRKWVPDFLCTILVLVTILPGCAGRRTKDPAVMLQWASEEFSTKDDQSWCSR